MRLQFFLVGLASSVALSSELDTGELRLIGDDATAVFGTDLERYGGSPLARFFPTEVPSVFGTSVPQGFVWVEYSNSNLTIYRGATSALNIAELRHRFGGVPEDNTRSAEIILQQNHSGVPVALTDNLAVAILDAQTAIFGDAATLKRAIARWKSPSPIGPIPSTIRELSQTYDGWFFLARPLQKLETESSGTTAKYRSELIKAIIELKGGVRIGGINNFYLEATARRFEDAQTLAGLAEWLPGMIQARAGIEGRIVEAIENLDAHALGPKASMSFTIADQKLENIIAEAGSAPRGVSGAQ